MNREALQKYKKAGRLARKLRNKYSKKIKPGIKLVNIAEDIESEIIKKGAKPAFPVNISINEVAAHYTPTLNDKEVFKEKDLVKLDLGVHMDGYIADTAVTVNLGSNNKNIINAVEEALEAAIDIIKPGIKTFEIEKVLETKIREKGVNPVANLTGHRIKRWTLHTDGPIHCVNTNSSKVISKGEVLAIEPFATNGDGWVIRSPTSLIYSFEKKKPVRMRLARKILGFIEKEYKHLPFAKRWLEKNFPKLRLNLALNRLEGIDAIYSYPILEERSNSFIAQAEHTILVDDTPIILT